SYTRIGEPSSRWVCVTSTMPSSVSAMRIPPPSMMKYSLLSLHSHLFNAEALREIPRSPNQLRTCLFVQSERICVPSSLNMTPQLLYSLRVAEGYLRLSLTRLRRDRVINA